MVRQVHVGAVLQQLAHRGHVVHLRRQMQRRLAVERHGVDVGARDYEAVEVHRAAARHRIHITDSFLSSCCLLLTHVHLTQTTNQPDASSPTHLLAAAACSGVRPLRSSMST